MTQLVNYGAGSRTEAAAPITRRLIGRVVEPRFVGSRLIDGDDLDRAAVQSAEPLAQAELRQKQTRARVHEHESEAGG